MATVRFEILGSLALGIGNLNSMVITIVGAQLQEQRPRVISEWMLWVCIIQALNVESLCKDLAGPDPQPRMYLQRTLEQQY